MCVLDSAEGAAHATTGGICQTGHLQIGRRVCYRQRMAEAIKHDERAEDGQVHSRMRSYVTTEAEYRAHVQRGRASGQTGPNRDFETVDAEIRLSLQAA